MSNASKLKGLYVITDDHLTPDATLYAQVEDALEGGASIVQLRDKQNNDEIIREKANKLQELCHKYDALFVLNDKVELAYELQCDGLHIGKSDHHRFKEIRENFSGLIGVSCYGDIDLAREFERLGADYVAFGSFYLSATKPKANIVPLNTLSIARNRINIPVCAIGGIESKNIQEIMSHKPHMVSLISDIWTHDDVKSQSQFYVEQF